jgi:hypothetical protein
MTGASHVFDLSSKGHRVSSPEAASAKATVISENGIPARSWVKDLGFDDIDGGDAR